jgi:hypothetical protein
MGVVKKMVMYSLQHVVSWSTKMFSTHHFGLCFFQFPNVLIVNHHKLIMHLLKSLCFEQNVQNTFFDKK